MIFKAHGYQERAIKWVESHRRCLLFLDMGLGKSVITLTAVQRLIDHAEVERVLVVAPKKVAESTWGTEVSKWDHLGIRVSIVAGDVKKREKALAADADVYVISRDSVAWLAAMSGVKVFDMLVLDELTSFKNHRSQRFKATRILSERAERVVGLTGTPTPNGLVDLWAEVAIVDRCERFGRSFRNFTMEYFRTIERNHIVLRYIPKPGASAAIGKKIEDIALTMKAEDWLELPGLIEHDVEVELGEKVLNRYREFERARVMELVDSGEEVTAMSAAALTNKLSQYANGAVYAEGGVLWGEVHRAKLEMLSEILESAGDNVLCFYQYKHDCHRILETMSGYGPRVYEGTDDLEDWNAGKIRLLLAHPASTAFGLNLQRGGHTVVWFSTGWNLELYQQANARLHRQGQEHPVIVHRLIARGTIDERMKGAIDGKGMSQEEFLKKMKETITKNYKK